MTAAVVWVDSQQLRLLHLSEDQMRREVFPLNGVPLSQLLARFASGISPSARILILGPAHSAQQFLADLRREQPELGRRVVGCETVPEHSDQSVADWVRKYFQKPVVA